MNAMKLVDGCLPLQRTEWTGVGRTLPKMYRHLAMTVVAALIASCLAGCAAELPVRRSDEGRLYRLDSAQLQPDAAVGFLSGLAVIYYPGFSARHLDLLPTGDSIFSTKGVPGKPIPYLNHRFGNTQIFESGCSSMVGIRIRGWLLLEKAGTYRFQALSNDGVRVTLGGFLILDDPQQHSDQLSEVAQVAVQAPGWYPIQVEYFQRKGTATLEFYWHPPGASELSPVPAEVLAHSP